METQIPRRDLRLAEGVAQKLPHVLSGRGLQVCFKDWVLTSHAGLSLLFGVVDVDKVERLEALTNPQLVHHLSTALEGLPVYLSNSSGLRFVVLLNKRPQLPAKVDVPELIPGRCLVGVKATGETLAIPWSSLGHLLVAGKSGHGKSGFLRLVAYQAIGEGIQLLVSDVNQTTLPMLSGHPSLLAPIAVTAKESAALVERALGECENRLALYAQSPNYPETIEEYNRQASELGLEPLRRLLVLIDEASAILQAMGGAGGEMGRNLARLGWQGRKFGVSLVLAAQDFSKELLGPVRDQIGAAVCFLVERAQLARMLGCDGADRINRGRPGLAITNHWGPVQTFLLSKDRLIRAAAPGGTAQLIPANLARLARLALSETGGQMSLGDLQRWGMTEREARTLAESWERRGWLSRGANRARFITQTLRELLGDG